MKGIQNTITGNFSSIVSNNRRFYVPKFQRDYLWEGEQWDDLWQDVMSMVDNTDEHYMGYLVLQTENEKSYYIIDGQQRFTTIIMLILAAIKNIQRFVEKGIESEENARRIENLKRTFLGKEDPVTLEYDNILVLNRNNDPYYRDYIIKLGELRVRNLKTTEKLMKQCFEFFDQKLKGLYNSGRDYAKFIQYVVDNLYFTQIVVNDEMNAFRVFETLNARGVQLSSADLLKNYLFALVDQDHAHESHIEVLENRWARLTDNIKAEKLPEFLRYYWNTSHKSIRSNEVFKTIRKEIIDDKQVFQLVDQMLRYSDVYMALRNPNDETWTDDQVKNDIALLNLFRLKQPYSLLMSAKINLTDAEFKELLHLIIKLCFRYNVICDRNPNDQELPFNNLALLVSNEHRVDKTLLIPIIVSDQEFQNAFQEKSFRYNSNNAKIIRYILGRIEQFKGSALGTRFDNENASIEHVFPQSFDESWDIDEDRAQSLVFRLGNTCLLEKRLNRDLQDAPFKTKKEVYSLSAFYYAHYIGSEFEDWNENSIVRLQKEMAKAAVTIWKL